jgi:phospholipid transport system transporter-binding protein
VGVALAAAAHGAFELQAGSGGQLSARGPLTFATARRAREAGLQRLAAGSGALEVDCAGITVVDSAGLAVLVDWLGRAKRAQRKLCYRHLPDGVVALARISDLEELLERGV